MRGKGHKHIPREEYERSKTTAKTSNAATSSNTKKDAVTLYEEVSKYVVTVENDKDNNNLQGSGVLFRHGYDNKKSKDFEWLITNAHVINNANRILIKKNGRRYPAVLRYVDHDLDLALLNLYDFKIPDLSIKDGDSTKIGEKVYAIGSPFGLDNSMTEGIISAKRILKGIKLIQATAPISSGNSGGGLFDESGNLVGITTFKRLGGENLNFSVDAFYVKELIETLKASEISRIFLDTYVNSDQNIKKLESDEFTKWLSTQSLSNGKKVYEYILDKYEENAPNFKNGGMKIFEKQIWNIFEYFLDQ
ncbi:MAG TPA: S1C family serine protease [Polynucleobacter sp.]|nr:S1C family serine protease [Acidovorax sp.]HQT21415.1 S1C family serine protease [Polynucleobacter sp.]